MHAHCLNIGLFCPSLHVGGSERQLVNLAKALRVRGYAVSVLILYGGGELEEELKRAGVPVFCLNKRRRIGVIPTLFRLVAYLRRNRIHVLYAFHGLPNLLTVAVTPFNWSVKRVIGIQATCIDMSAQPWVRRLAYRSEPIFSRFAHLVIANSYAGRDYAIKRGFPKHKLRVIQNGIDTERFVPDRAGGLRLRRQLDIRDDEFLIGMVGRVDPVKGHKLFFESAVKVAQQRPEAKFICVWAGDPAEQQRLAQLANSLGLVNLLSWVRGGSTMVDIYNAIDVVVQSSLSEGLPNVIGEAMACGRSCVVTDVGDSAILVTGIGIVVPARDATCLADGILRAVVTVGNCRLADLGRERIVSRFSVTRMTDMVLKELLQLAGGSFA